MRRYSVKRFCSVFIILLFCCLSVRHLEAQTSGDIRKQVSLHYYRGVVYYEAKRYYDALREFQEVATVDPRYKKTSHYIESAIDMMDRNRLRRVDHMEEQDQKDAAGNTIDLYFLGKKYYERGDCRRAVDAFEVVLRRDPSDRFASYYLKRCQKILGASSSQSDQLLAQRDLFSGIQALEKEVAFVKEELKDQQRMERIVETQVERRVARGELIRKKELQLKEQEALIDEERQDYLAQLKITKRTKKLRKESARWRRLKENLAEGSPGVPTDLTEFPAVLDRANHYYSLMKKTLSQSRWNSAGMNAYYTAIYYSDAVLIYFHGMRSAAPHHENIAQLLERHLDRSDVEINGFLLRNILKLNKIVQTEDRPFKRREAVFLSENVEKLVEWCRSILP